MKVSIITATYNSAETLEETIRSLISQSYPDIEYIVVDGGSTDGTLGIINKYENKIAKVISEKDNGMYDALNKGILLSTGEIVGILNSDDLYYDKDVIKTIVQKMEESGAEVCWGDLVYVKRKDTSAIVRLWKSSEYKPGLFQKGWHPPHPAFFVKKAAYDKYGLFNLDFKISADYELMLRFLEKYKSRSCYTPKFLVKMRDGGKTRKSIFNLANILKYKWEDCHAWEVNGLKANPFLVFFLKSLSKIPQLLAR